MALSGLENILRVGKQDAFQNDGINQFAVMVEEAYGKSVGCSTSFPGSSLFLPRESTLVAAGHVSMYTNQIRTGGGFLT